MKKICLVAFVIPLLILCCIPEADASGCRHVVVVKHHTPYVAPHYVAPHHDYIKYVPVAIAPDYFWSTRDYYRDQLLADAIAYRLLAAQNGNAQKGGSETRPPQNSRMPQAEDVRPSETQERGVPASFLADVSSHCASCHTKGSEKGGLAIMDGNRLAQLSPEQVGKILHRVTLDVNDPKIMPPKGRTMSMETRLRFTNRLVGGGE